MNFVKSDFQEEISEIIDQIKQNAENSMLIQYVENPAISLFRVRLLYVFLRQCGLDENVIRHYIVTAMLVQLGFDTHEQVSLGKEETLNGMRTRQLSVLAGDYFSSRYYFLLAEIEDVAIIRALAGGIERVNERKIVLYHRRDMKAEDYLQGKVYIEVQLIQSFIDVLAGERTAVWTDFATHMLLIEQLIMEYKAYKWNQPYGRYLQLLSEEEGTYHGYTLLIHRIHKALHQCRKLIHVLGEEEWKNELKILLDEYAAGLDDLNARAEEM